MKDDVIMIVMEYCACSVEGNKKKKTIFFSCFQV